MMRMKTRPTGMSPKNGSSHGGGGGDGSELVDWELRPGGMLVQKRNPDSDRASIPAPTIRLRVKHGHAYHEIYISSQASFGELKKMLSAPTGLHPQDQKLLFKDKERDSKTYLDFVGVKDRSKIVLVEDATSQEKRFLEMRRTAVMEKASKSISEISLEVDKLASKVAALESIITKGKKVAETDVLNLIELLMNQLIKLDGIIADGDVKLQRRMQVKRVQKYVETLDMLKIKNAMPTTTNSTTTTNGGQTPIQPRRHSTGQIPPTQVSSQQHHHQQQQPQSARRSTTNGSVAQTTKWETFEPPALIQFPSSSTTTATTTTTTTTTPANKLNWEFFD